MRGGRVLLVMLALLGIPGGLSAQHLLVPMDKTQANHLKAYGLTYWTLERQTSAEWLLNYRGGSFLLPARDDVRREAALRGVTTVEVSAADVAEMRGVI